MVQSKSLSSMGDGVGTDARGSAVSAQEGGCRPVGALLVEGTPSLHKSEKWYWRLNFNHSDLFRLLVAYLIDNVW